MNRDDRGEASAGRGYWDRAGDVGYGEAMYASSEVEQHIRGRLWHMMLDIADDIGVPRAGSVLDLGCGDGAFANEMLAWRYAAVHGIDISRSAICRAADRAPGPHLRFEAHDLATFDYSSLPRYDGAFLVGILHHVPAAAPKILQALAHHAGRIVVLEPNGAHPLRKLLELTPSYRAAGEDSFTASRLRRMFNEGGFEVLVHRRANLLPNFTPKPVFDLLVPLEKVVEGTRLLNPLCTVNLFGLGSGKGA